jgi:hypothetical protein
VEVACRAAMEDEDAELEEGEAKEPLDPDTDFSYLVNAPLHSAQLGRNSVPSTSPPARADGAIRRPVCSAFRGRMSAICPVALPI